ncbi:MAG: hypothetical protein ACJAWV_002150 [Flammeovirgaceae bacterium]|jgi:hypothetical protein
MKVFKQFLEYFDKQKWRYQLPEESQNIATFGMRTQEGTFHCILDVDLEDKKIIFLSIYPVNVPEKLRSSMAELILRLNYILFFGGFEMDFDDGEIRFKTSLIYDDLELTEKSIDHIIKGNIKSIETHFELLNSFITEKIEMERVIEVLAEMQKDAMQQ